MRNDVRQRGLAQAGHADENFKLLARLGLADVVVEQLGPQCPLDGFFLGGGGRGRQHAPHWWQVGQVEVVGLDGH